VIFSNFWKLYFTW